jgi:ABC-type sugar transport system ATPase subunit
MDEPLSNLDAQLRLQTRVELKRLHRELGTTMIYVTHDQGEAMTLGTRIAIMRGGAIEQIGSPLDLYRCPVNTFVATFLGSPPMNVIGDALTGAGVQLGIRPEDVEIAATAADGWQAARVVVVEPMGSETLVTLDYRDQRLVARVAATRGFDPGQCVWVNLPVDRSVRFDSAGRRLAAPPGGREPF